MQITIEQAQEDIAFLVMRSNEAGSCHFGGDRWTGLSSNALVRFAYGGKHDCMPSDRSDYAACVRTFLKLPKHRRTKAVREALKKAKEAYLENYPEDRSSLARRAAHLRWEEKRREREAKERKRWERRMKRK